MRNFVIFLTIFSKHVCACYEISHCFVSGVFQNLMQDKAKAVEILVGDLKMFSTFNEELYKEITQLLTLTNFR